jgi:hypothetical protein
MFQNFFRFFCFSVLISEKSVKTQRFEQTVPYPEAAGIQKKAELPSWWNRKTKPVSLPANVKDPLYCRFTVKRVRFSWFF